MEESTCKSGLSLKQFVRSHRMAKEIVRWTCIKCYAIANT